MRRIKVVIIDKDILARRALSETLRGDNNFKLLEASGDIAGAQSTITNRDPDVLLFNIESLDSKEYKVFLTLRETFPELPIVILSPRTEEGAYTTVEAIKNGAIDVITKSEEYTGLLFASRHLSKRVVPIVKNAGTNVNDHASGIFKYEQNYQPVFESESSGFKEEINQPIRIIVIGGCTGGPKALFSLIPSLPENLSFPVVIAQHFPKKFTRILARELQKKSTLKVREGFDRAVLEPGTVWIAPGGLHSEIHRTSASDSVLRIYKGVRELGNRPSINILFRSAENAYNSETMGIILSGIGRDGVEGAAAIRNRGGKILVQDPKTAVAPELPFSVFKARITNRFYSIDEIAHYIEQQNKFCIDREKKGRIRSRTPKRRQANPMLYNYL